MKLFPNRWAARIANRVPRLRTCTWTPASNMSDDGAIPTTGWLSRMLPVEPWKAASPKANTPPSAAETEAMLRPVSRNFIPNGYR